jgi:ketosteroid isomerase-like protein
MGGVQDPATPPLDTEIRRLEHAVQDALRRRDMDFLEQVLAPEFTLTTGRPGSEVRSRSEWLEVSARTYQVSSFGFDEIVVQRYGEVAVARARYRQVARMGEADRTGTFRMTDVWHHREGRWQLVCRHSTAVSP